jgi:agmatinase
VECDYESSRAVLLPVPYDLTTSYRPGTRLGPQAIIDASRFVELHDEEIEGDVSVLGLHTLPALPPVVSGPRDMVAAVEASVAGHVANGKLVALLGGEHSLTLGAVRAHREKWPGLSVLQLDAHADLRDSYEGSAWSHACVMRRVAELAPSVQVGIRSLSSEESEFASSGKAEIITARQVRKGAVAPEAIAARLSRDVYLTIDCDVFDPALVPAVGTPEPGGLDWYDVVDLIEAVSREHRIVGFDIVELSPLPGMVASDFTIARLTYRVLGLAFRSQGAWPLGSGAVGGRRG